MLEPSPLRLHATLDAHGLSARPVLLCCCLMLVLLLVLLQRGCALPVEAHPR